MAYTGKQVGLTGLFYKYRTDTVTPPGDGEIRMDNIVLASVTKIYISVVDAEGDNNEQVLTDWPDIGTVLVIASTTDTSIYFQFEITAITVFTGSYIEWTVVSGKVNPAGFSNNHKMHISTSTIGFQQALSLKSGELAASASLAAILAGKNVGDVLVVNATKKGFDIVSIIPPYYNFVNDESASSTEHNTPILKLELTDTFGDGIQYEWMATWEIQNTHINGHCQAEVRDDGVQMNHAMIEPKDADNWHPMTVFSSFVGEGTLRTLDIRFWNFGHGTAYIRRARISIKSVQ